MTTELAQAGYNRTPPFHGDTCEVKDLDKIQLWNCYMVAFALVTATSTHPTYKSLQDWHLHDGYITKSRELPVGEWQAWLDSPESLLSAWEAEDCCHRTVYPYDMAWCLRFLSWEDLSKHANAFALDLSGDPRLVKEFAQSVRDLYQVEPTVKNASDWLIESGYTDLSPENVKLYLENAPDF